MGWFDGNRGIGKMSLDEKISLLKELQTEFVQKSMWTADWLKANGLACPAPDEDGKKQCEALKAEAEELQKEITVSKELAEGLKKEIETLKKEAEEAQKELCVLQQRLEEERKKQAASGAVVPVFSKEELEGWKGEIKEELNRMMEVLTGKIDNENRELVHVLEKTEDKLMRKEADVQSFQEDSRLKATAPFLKQFIRMGDMMRDMLKDVPEDRTKAAGYLLEQVRRLTETVDYTLRDFSVEVLVHDSENTRFDPNTQQQVLECPTDNPELDKKVSRTIHPGYVWTLPYILKAKANGEEHPLKEYRMVFRREQVECYKYNQNQNNN